MAGDLAPTKERIVREAIRLFAERGYKATTVAAIEEAVGLSPGSGGLYKHFPSKQAVLLQGLEDQMERITRMAELLELRPPFSPGGQSTADEVAEMRTMARLAIDELQHASDLQRLLLREAEAITALKPTLVDDWIHGTYRRAAEHMRRRYQQSGLDPSARDLEAHAFVSMAPLVLFHVVEWVSGSTPMDLDTDRLIDAWIEVQLAVHRTIPSIPAVPPPPPATS